MGDEDWCLELGARAQALNSQGGQVRSWVLGIRMIHASPGMSAVSMIEDQKSSYKFSDNVNPRMLGQSWKRRGIH